MPESPPESPKKSPPAVRDSGPRRDVFLSSTFVDLEPYRAEVIRSIRNAGYRVDPMEDWTADPRTPRKFSRDRVGDSHICILLVARRRGYVPAGDERSITQQEYDEARVCEIPVLAFVLDDAADWPPAWDERASDPKTLEWREELRVSHGTPYFAPDPAELSRMVLAALSRMALEALESRPGSFAGPEAVPTPLTAFFGRERDIESLTDLLRQKSRFVTVRAPGGYGKTRLALETVRRLGDSSRTIAFVDLAEAQTVIELATCVASTMGLNLDRLSQEDPVQLVGRVLQGASGVLILDNFEQLPTEARQTVEAWAGRAPEVRFLITSRVALDRTGERIFDLGTFPFPEPDDATDPRKVAENPALQLFADRVRAFRPDFALTAEAARSAIAICRRVECQPLLIEILASQLRSRSLSTIVDDLEDEAWLETIESAQSSFGKTSAATAIATLRWSYNLLDEVSRAAFVATCVFHGGFDASAAARVVPVPDKKALRRTLETLSNYCFLKYDPVADRYYPFAQTIREFGRGFWPDRETPADLGERWARYYLAFAARNNADLGTPGVVAALLSLESERENILESQLWAAENGHPDLAADLLLAAVDLLAIRGPLAVARDRLVRAIAPADTDPTRTCRLYLKLCLIFRGLGDYVSAQKQASFATTLADGLGDALLSAQCDYGYALVIRNSDESFRLLNRALKTLARPELAEDREAARFAALAQGFLGYATDQLGLYDTSIAWFGQALESLDRLGNSLDRGSLLSGMGLAFWHSGDPQGAIELFLDAETAHERLGNRLWMAGAITNRGLAYTDLDEWDSALGCLDRAVEVLHEVGNVAWVAVNRGGHGRALARSGETDRGVGEMRTARATALRQGDKSDAAMHAGFCGRELYRVGRYAEAVEELRASIGFATESCCTDTLRFAGNLAYLAGACVRQSDTVAEEAARAELIGLARRSANRADELAIRHGVGAKHPVDSIAECYVILEEVRIRLDGDRG